MNDVNKNVEIESMVVLVTPELASKWLEKNIDNRNLRKNTINQYVNDMKNGKWSLVGDSITFDKDGILTNGQHRLYAIVQSNTSQYFNVMRGISHNMNMDRPAMRSVADNIRMFTDLPDLFSNKYLISMCRYILDILNIENRGVSVIYDFMETYKKEIIDFHMSIGIGNRNHKKCRNAPILSAIFLAYLNGVDKNILSKMIKTVANGEYVYEGYEINRFLPAVKLDKAIENIYFKSQQARYDAFLRTMFAVHSIENNKFLKLKNRPVDEIVYDITYEGKTLSNCHEVRMMNESYKINF